MFDMLKKIVACGGTLKLPMHDAAAAPLVRAGYVRVVPPAHVKEWASYVVTEAGLEALAMHEAKNK
jgi:hypothetical protein